ncbi:hypothetical protein RND81_10G012900 [Saponaria officinalis]|uniref:Retrotransposon gag domain-containing protein n=1 Tax=Saponaria officinalis TaxID=3572 RepID=A0AAW1HXB1_SAPOF
MKPDGADDEYLMLRAFPFSLKDAARDWLYYLPPNSMTTWQTMKEVFLAQYFPTSQSSLLKKQISNIEQLDGETMYEYRERFKRICASCPYHGYSQEDLILYFCNSLNQEEARMVNAASGGSIINKTIEEANNLLEELAASSRHFRTKSRGVHMVKDQPSQRETKLQDQVNSLTNMVKSLIQGKEGVKDQGCENFDSYNNDYSSCPQNEDDSENVNAVGAFGGKTHHPTSHDPFSNTYNPGWRDHPNFRWSNQEEQPRPRWNNNQNGQFGESSQFQQNNRQQNPRPQFNQSNPNQFNQGSQYHNKQFNQNPPPQPQPPPQKAGMSTEDLVLSLANSMQTMQGNLTTFQAMVIQNQNDNKSSITNLERQIGQLSSAIGKLEARDSNNLPPVITPNPNNVCAVSLRNGRELVELEKKKKRPRQTSPMPTLERQEEEEIFVQIEDSSGEVDKEKHKEGSTSKDEYVDKTPPMGSPVYEPRAPFPDALKETRKHEQDKDIYETFRNCEVNIPLINLLKSVPRYAKFLKELCTVKRNNKLKATKKVRENGLLIPC